MAKVKMINSIFGNEMLVDEERVEEYQAAGHKLAAPGRVKEPEEAKEPEKPEEMKKSKKK